jgi:hypothetical protein
VASKIDIWNLALSHFGNAANVSAPTEESAEAEHCRRFYPIALREALEAHAWTFASKRATLAELATNPREDFEHAYSLPADCVKPRKMLPEGYTDSENDGAVFEWWGTTLYTDEANASLVYTFALDDTTKFSPLFVIGLSYLLAGYLVGPMRKDETGKSQAAMRNLAEHKLFVAAASNASATRHRATHTPTAARVR